MSKTNELKAVSLAKYIKALSPQKKRELAAELARPGDMNYIYQCASGWGRPRAPLEIIAITQFAMRNPTEDGLTVTQESILEGYRAENPKKKRS